MLRITLFAAKTGPLVSFLWGTISAEIGALVTYAYEYTIEIVAPEMIIYARILYSRYDYVMQWKKLGHTTVTIDGVPCHLISNNDADLHLKQSIHDGFAI